MDSPLENLDCEYFFFFLDCEYFDIPIYDPAWFNLDWSRKKIQENRKKKFTDLFFNNEM